MPAPRYLLLIAGIIGVFAVFRPLVGVGKGPLRIQLSAYDLSFGMDRTHKLLDKKLPSTVEKRLPADWRETRDDIKLVADAAKHAALAYIPVALLLLLGAFATWRKRTGRIEGGIAILLGLASIAAWIGMRYGVWYGLQEEPALARLHFELKWSAHVLIVCGLVAIVAGVQALLGPTAPAGSGSPSRPGSVATR